MVTLINRATPSQARIFKIVAGAVCNAAHGHLDFKIPPAFAKSVAKRATGTLTAQGPEVLAAKYMPSDCRSVSISKTAPTMS